MTTVESDISPRIVALNASANGTVEAGDNCVIADGKLTFKDKSKGASFKVTANDGYEVKVSSNTGDMNVDNGTVVLDTTTDYGTVNVAFNEIPKPVETPAPATAPPQRLLPARRPRAARLRGRRLLRSQLLHSPLLLSRLQRPRQQVPVRFRTA